jgi:RES domain-containing protein
MTELGCAWEDLFERAITPPPHALAEQLIADGVAGMIVPSFAPGAPHGGANLVVWRWSRSLPYQIRCIDDQGRLSG